MTRLRVTFGESTAADLLVSLGAIADPAWRGTFARAPEDARLAGRTLARRAERFGRYAFLNLLGPLAEAPGTSAALLAALRKTPAADLQLTLLGARRRQLRELLPAPTLDDRRAIRTALAGTILTAPRWLLAAPPAEVKAELLDLLAAWRAVRYPAAAERALRTAVEAEVRERRAASRGRSGVATIAAVAGGLTYDPPSAPRTVLLLPAPSVRPIVVVVDDVATHVVAYAPAVPADPRARLLDLTRALADETRLAILELLRDGPRSTSELTDAVGLPRTTLLHHLALLRAAGLLTTTVETGSTRYALRPEAVGELHRAVVTVLQ